jgi:DNA-binding GntR family transcriptional regulator
MDKRGVTMASAATATDFPRAVPDAEAPGWRPVRPRTLVDHAVEAIVAGAARGAILPGDHIVETDLARALGMSRVPVREALRLLESQGLVSSVPYKGIRLIPITRERLDHVVEVRVALETTAARRAFAGRAAGSEAVRGLQRIIDELELMATRQDGYGLASADAAFHRELCRLSGNEVLCSVWEGLARQLTIVVGLSTLDKPMDRIVTEHRVLLETLVRGQAAEIDRAIEEHIRDQNAALDFEAIVAARRAARARPARGAAGILGR